MATRFQKDTNGTLTTGLISYYKLENATDYFGSQSGTDANVTYSAGKVNSGATFNGTTSKIDLPTDTIDTLNPVSFAFWMKTSSASDQVLMQFDNAGDTNNMYIRSSFTTVHKLDLVIFNGLTDTKVTTATSVDTGAWIFVVITYSGTTANIYLNGNSTADATNAAMSNITAGSDRRAFGYFRLSSILWYNGSLDEIGIWSKVLSATEIADLYNAGAGQTMTGKIAFDASTSPSASINITTSFTWNHTCVGTDRLLVVGLNEQNTTADTVTGVTYNGVAMSRINFASLAGPSTDYLYAMVAPTEGTNAIVVSFSGTRTFVSASASYVGVSQIGLPDAQNTATASSVASISCSVTTIADKSWLIGYYANNGGNSTAGSNTFQRQIANGTSNRAIYDSNADQTPAGSFSLTVNNANAAVAYILNVMSVAPSVALSTAKGALIMAALAIS